MSATCPFCYAVIEVDATRCSSCNGAIDPLLAPGERVAERFQILEALGSGPLGTSYRARDLKAGVELGLQILADELVPTPEERATFLSRIEMFAGRTIAGCVMPLEIGADPSRAFVTVPFVEGVSLRAVLGARSALRKPLAPEESLRVLLALAASLSALHSATPHGALGPDSVVITPRGLLLTDCTLGVAVAADKIQPRMQKFARAVPYVSPEAARGKRITAVADLYAFGAIASELLTGSPSLRALDSAALDPALDAAIRALLDREPTKRPAAVGALLDALSRSAGFERRPPQAPLPVPEVPTAAPRASVPPQAIASLATSGAPPLSRPSQRETTVTVPGRRSLTPPQLAALSPQPRAPASVDPRPGVGRRIPSLPSDLQPSARPMPADAPGSGRVNPPTAPMPTARTAMSGPPGGLDSSRSGPPPEMRRASIPSVPSALAAPRIPTLPPIASPSPRVPSLAARPDENKSTRNASTPESERSLDGIDPRLLRAARKLEAERREGEGEEIDVGEIELVDD